MPYIKKDDWCPKCGQPNSECFCDGLTPFQRALRAGLPGQGLEGRQDMLTDRLVWWVTRHKCIMYSDGWCEVHLNAIRGNTSSNPDYRLIRRQFTRITCEGQQAGAKWCDRIANGASQAARND